MIEMNSMNTMAGGAATGVQGLSNVKLELPKAGAGESEAFRAALDRQMAVQDGTHGLASNRQSLGDVVGTRFSGLASEYQKDQQHVSKLLEKATRTGDSVHLVRAMLALNDYQIRIQAMSKTVSKAASSIDQLTKMQ